jgi:protein ImuA
MTVNAREIIEGLREDIRRIERRPPQRACFVSSGRPEIDALLPGGGFPRGALTELAGGPASGKTGVVLSALAAAMGTEGFAAFVDGRGELYPPAVTAFGVDLARLLVVRPVVPERGEGESVRRALWAAEALLASGAFEVVAVDVPIERARARVLGMGSLEGMLLRLRAAAEKGGVVALWLGSPEGARAPSAVRLELSAGAAGVQVRRAFARGAEDAPWPEWRGTSHLPALGASHAA